MTSNDLSDNKIYTNVRSDLHYKKKGEKDRVSNNFNACETAQYQEQKQKKKSDLEYTKAGWRFFPKVTFGYQSEFFWKSQVQFGPSKLDVKQRIKVEVALDFTVPSSFTLSLSAHFGTWAV